MTAPSMSGLGISDSSMYRSPTTRHRFPMRVSRRYESRSPTSSQKGVAENAKREPTVAEEKLEGICRDTKRSDGFLEATTEGLEFHDVQSLAVSGIVEAPHKEPSHQPAPPPDSHERSTVRLPENIRAKTHHQREKGGAVLIKTSEHIKPNPNNTT